MSDRPVPFRNAKAFWRASNPFDIQFFPRSCWLVHYFGKPTTLPVRSEEEIEAAAKELYKILGMEHGFVPQNEIGRTTLSHDDVDPV